MKCLTPFVIDQMIALFKQVTFEVLPKDLKERLFQQIDDRGHSYESLCDTLLQYTPIYLKPRFVKKFYGAIQHTDRAHFQKFAQDQIQAACKQMIEIGQSNTFDGDARTTLSHILLKTPITQSDMEEVDRLVGEDLKYIEQIQLAAL